MVVAAIILVKLGQEAYRWYAYADERQQIRTMSLRLEDAGFGVIRTQLEADSLRDVIVASDSVLSAFRPRLERYERRATLGTLPSTLHDSYRAELERYNRLVEERNARLYEWETVIGRNHEVVDRFNRLADSIRAVAAAMGEPYYDVPGPVEMAARRGLVAPD